MKPFSKSLGVEIQQAKCANCQKELEPNFIYVRTKESNTTHLNLILVCADDYAFRTTNFGDSITTSLWTYTWLGYRIGPPACDESEVLYCSESCVVSVLDKTVDSILECFPFFPKAVRDTRRQIAFVNSTLVTSSNAETMRKSSKKAENLLKKLREAKIDFSAD